MDANARHVSGSIPAIDKPTVIVKTVYGLSLARGVEELFHVQATTRNPQTITTGPPVF
jgi:hypothetical protein